MKSKQIPIGTMHTYKHTYSALSWTISHTVITSVDAKHHGASLSERWNVTWVGNNSVCTH